jgi:hypothetical protein
MGLYLYRTNHFVWLCLLCTRKGFILLRFAFYSCIGREWKALTAATDHFYIYNFCWPIGKSFSCGNCNSCKNTSPTLDPVLVIILQTNQSGTLVFIQPIRV